MDFPDNIIVAWPREGSSTERSIYNINRNANLRHGVTFEDFGLSYPVTITDVVDNWEKVGALMAATGPFEWDWEFN